MRGLLILLVPAIWGFMWLVIRALMNQRAAAPGAGRVFEGSYREARQSREYGPLPDDEGPPCQRHNLHLFLRLFGAERACKHCATVMREREARERDEAIREAERYMSGSAGDDAPPDRRKTP